MVIKFDDSTTTDYNVVYYANNVYVKTNCILRQYMNTDGIFEADNIVDSIYLGNINSVYDIKKLKELGITHIVSVIAGFIPPYPEDFNYLVINALDTVNTELFENFNTANEFISEALDNDGKVLIHCMAGRSRSATIVSAYIIKTFGMDAKNTVNSVKSKREIVQPNDAFVKQLEKYYNLLYN